MFILVQRLRAAAKSYPRKKLSSLSVLKEGLTDSGEVVFFNSQLNLNKKKCTNAKTHIKLS